MFEPFTHRELIVYSVALTLIMPTIINWVKTAFYWIGEHV